MNYTSAWELLVQRYENKRLLVNVQLKMLFNQQRITLESAQNIKKLLDTTVESVHSLRNLGVDVSNWDVLLNYVVVQNLTSESHMMGAIARWFRRVTDIHPTH